jgi:hypothetical protein
MLRFPTIYTLHIYMRACVCVCVCVCVCICRIWTYPIKVFVIVEIKTSLGVYEKKAIYIICTEIIY